MGGHGCVYLMLGSGPPTLSLFVNMHAHMGVNHVSVFVNVWIIWFVGCFPALGLFICVCVCVWGLLGFDSQSGAGIWGRCLCVNIDSSKFYFIADLFSNATQPAAETLPRLAAAASALRQTNNALVCAAPDGAVWTSPLHHAAHINTGRNCFFLRLKDHIDLWKLVAGAFFSSFLPAQ